MLIGKKLLGTFALLFAYGLNAVKSVEVKILSCESVGVTVTNECTDGNVDINATSICLDDGVVYTYSSDNSKKGCYQKKNKIGDDDLTEGFHLLSVANGEYSGALKINNFSYLSTFNGYMAILKCDKNIKCRQTYGIVKDERTDYNYCYEIGKNGNKEIDLNDSNVNSFQCTGNDKIGLFSKDKKLCIGDGKSVELPTTSAENKNYLLIGKEGSTKNPIANDSVFKGLNLGGEDNGIIITAQYITEDAPSMLVFDPTYTVINDCFDTTNNSISNRIDNLCNTSSRCDFYYFCHSGICTKSPSVDPENNEFKEPEPEEKTPGLNDCSKIICNYSDGPVYCISENVIYELDCAINIKKPIENIGIYGFITGEQSTDLGFKVFDNGVANFSVEDYNNLTNLSLYDCIYDVQDKIICKPTYGYIFKNINEYVEVGVNSNKYYESYDNGCNGNTDIGKIYNSSDNTDPVPVPALCIDGSKGVEILSDGNKNYFVKNIPNNIFNGNDGQNTKNNDKYIVVKASPSAFTIVVNDYDYCDGENGEAIETFKGVCNSGVDDNPCGEGAPIYESINGLVSKDTSCRIKIDSKTTPGTRIVTETVNCKKGYYVFNDEADEDDGYNHLQAKDTAGILYYCQQDAETTGKINCADFTVSVDYELGYYKNAAASSETSTTDAYIKCAGNNNACKVIDTSNDCTHAGDIIFISEEKGYGLCLDQGEDISPVPINTAAEPVKQFVSLDPPLDSTSSETGNVFGEYREGKYISVIAKSGNVIVDSDGSSNRYIFTDEDYIHRSKEAENTVNYNHAICDNEKYIVEFKKVYKKEDRTTNEDANIYEKQGTFKWPQKV